MDIAFSKNWANLFEIDITPLSGTPTWARIGAGITTADPDGNEEIDQTGYYDGGGMSTSDVTGGQLIIAFEGHRKVGDKAQDYIAGLAYEFGEARHTQVRWTDPSGSVVEGDCTIANIKNMGGDANEKSTFSFEVHFNGTPAFTPGSARQFPESVTAKPIQALKVNASAKIEVTVTPVDSSPALVYAVSDDNILTVDSDGTAHGVKEGKAKVIVMSAAKPSIRSEIEVTVSAAA